MIEKKQKIKISKKLKKIIINKLNKKYYFFPKLNYIFYIINNKKLYKKSLLYCEGKEKPLLRGFIHLFYTLILPLFYYKYFYVNNNNINIINNQNNENNIIIFSFLSIFFCKFISALYHCISWTKHKEILIQKLDYCFISLMISGLHFPFIYYLLSFPYTIIFSIINIIFCIYTFINILIFNKIPSLIYIIHSIILLPFITLFSKKISLYFSFLYLLSLILYGIGFYIFKKKLNISFYPKLYGHHEVFHLLTIISNTIFIKLLEQL